MSFMLLFIFLFIFTFITLLDNNEKVAELPIKLPFTLVQNNPSTLSFNWLSDEMLFEFVERRLSHELTTNKFVYCDLIFKIFRTIKFANDFWLNNF